MDLWKSYLPSMYTERTEYKRYIRRKASKQFESLVMKSFFLARKQMAGFLYNSFMKEGARLRPGDKGKPLFKASLGKLLVPSPLGGQVTSIGRKEEDSIDRHWRLSLNGRSIKFQYKSDSIFIKVRLPQKHDDHQPHNKLNQTPNQPLELTSSLCWILAAGCWMLHVGCWTWDAGCRDVGC